MQRGFARLQQRHPLLGAGDQQRGKLKIGNQLHAAFNNLFFAFAFSCHCFELREVRRQQRRAAIAGKISPFRVDQHRHSGFTRQRDHLLNAGQRAFRIVRQYQRPNRAQRLIDTLMQRLRIHAFKAFFEVETNQLLVA